MYGIIYLGLLLVLGHHPCHCKTISFRQNDDEFPGLAQVVPLFLLWRLRRRWLRRGHMWSGSHRRGLSGYSRVCCCKFYNCCFRSLTSFLFRRHTLGNLQQTRAHISVEHNTLCDDTTVKVAAFTTNMACGGVCHLHTRLDGLRASGRTSERAIVPEVIKYG
jgi:hypothetical protein